MATVIEAAPGPKKEAMPMLAPASEEANPPRSGTTDGRGDQLKLMASPAHMDSTHSRLAPTRGYPVEASQSCA